MDFFQLPRALQQKRVGEKKFAVVFLLGFFCCEIDARERQQKSVVGSAAALNDAVRKQNRLVDASGHAAKVIHSGDNRRMYQLTFLGAVILWLSARHFLLIVM